MACFLTFVLREETYVAFQRKIAFVFSVSKGIDNSFHNFK
ncbi:hypothetical protein DB44_BG00030 [Candidatus Protochlamydia amoebophila]|uniref:Uncharacterized protein n=1 Tax=Candidatus Protochlamydia amoebophila TaxID=362787 RepID=A0A0C1H753_9BACT|nr:hypothetical protein DB44_BG00030 [Candidatus Protochlamydia amoebophila]